MHASVSSIRRCDPFIIQEAARAIIAGDLPVETEKTRRCSVATTLARLLVKWMPLAVGNSGEDLPKYQVPSRSCGGEDVCRRDWRQFAWTGRKSYEPYG